MIGNSNQFYALMSLYYEFTHTFSQLSSGFDSFTTEYPQADSTAGR